MGLLTVMQTSMTVHFDTFENVPHLHLLGKQMTCPDSI